MNTTTFDPESGTLRSRTYKALIWQGAGQTGERIARLLTNIILARLLLPEDFGIAGAVTAALAIVDSCMFLGSNQAILSSDRGRRKEFLDTAFWVAAVRGIAIGLMLLVAAPFLSTYLAQPRTMPMFAALALQPVISGLASPRSQILVKDLRFGTWSLYQAGCNMFGLLATVLMAVWTRNTWSLVLGQLFTQLAVSAFSYAIAPYWPRWQFDRDSWRELRTYGLRASGTPLIAMMILQAPTLLLGRAQGMAALGVFLLNQRLAAMPQNLFTRAVSTVALPAYSLIKNDAVRLASLWLRALRTLSLLMFPVGAVLIWVDTSLPTVIYGSQFSGAAGLFALLVADGALISIGVVTGPLFWAVGQPSYERNIQLARLVILYLTAFVLLPHYKMMGLAAGYAVSAMVCQVMLLICGKKLVGASWRQISAVLTPGAVLAGAVLGMLIWLNRLISFSNRQSVVLAAVVLTGAVLAVLLREYLYPVTRERRIGILNSVVNCE